MAQHRDGAFPAIFLIATVALAGISATAVHAADAINENADPAVQALQTLLNSEWEWRHAQFPERATSDGDHRYDDRLTDRSPAAAAARREHHRERLAAVLAIDPARLAGEDRVSWAILHFDAELDAHEDQIMQSVVPGHDPPWSADDSPLRINGMQGPQFDLPRLASDTRFQNEADYRHFLIRLQAIPASLRQLQFQLDAGRIVGWTPPRAALGRVPDQFATLLNPDLAHHPLFAPFQNFPTQIPPETRAQLTHAAELALHEAVIPAVQEFRNYLASVWIPAATETLGATQLPHGREYYALSLQRYNTTRMTAQEIHDLGLKEVARIDGELKATMKQAGFAGTLPEFRAFLRTDPRFQFSSAEDELVAFRDIAKRVDPQLPHLFAELPRLPYGVRAMPPEEGDNAPHYVTGAVDGSRAGYFEANTNNLSLWPRWTMEALFLHEAVPGHHLQISRAHELQALPKLRREHGNIGFSEGWALYAEGLGKELGLYADPYSQFGRLSLEALRACRLVVDTGLHSFGWSRAKAIAYLIEHAQLEAAFAEAEVNRYLAMPGQATAYKIGELRILALRQRAMAALGPRFDIRGFHNAVIDHGALPLTVLDGVIDDWIEAERTRPVT